MLKAEGVKTVSAPKSDNSKAKKSGRVLGLQIVAFLVAAILVAFGSFEISRKLSLHGQVILKAPEASYRLTVAKTATEQATGLGNLSSLPLNQGMLFPFTSAGERCFWMKDMRFPLDIIWLNPDKKVVAVLDDALPSSYPSTFCPKQPAQYVIELNANQSEVAGIKAGQTVSF